MYVYVYKWGVVCIVSRYILRYRHVVQNQTDMNFFPHHQTETIMFSLPSRPFALDQFTADSGASSPCLTCEGVVGWTIPSLAGPLVEGVCGI